VWDLARLGLWTFGLWQLDELEEVKSFFTRFAGNGNRKRFPGNAFPGFRLSGFRGVSGKFVVPASANFSIRHLLFGHIRYWVDFEHPEHAQYSRKFLTAFSAQWHTVFWESWPASHFCDQPLPNGQPFLVPRAPGKDHIETYINENEIRVNDSNWEVANRLMKDVTDGVDGCKLIGSSSVRRPLPQHTAARTVLLGSGPGELNWEYKLCRAGRSPKDQLFPVRAKVLALDVRAGTDLQ
jgi:hypothetical protein